ncbi:hypothetical protein JCM33374_g6563 [Metschnikowia sp. JCM 33374]|nr:hypothetical protein JCM33374_g6563 [Metschnikowia sp. JCM 33374]
MPIESRASISKCGLYVAVATGHDFHVHSLRPTSDPSFTPSIHYDLSRIFFKHKKLESWASFKPNIIVSIIEWEHLNTPQSTKVAVYSSNDELNLILIFDLAEEHPIVIEADSFGVERLQWLPIYSSEKSAYVNSTLLAVFTKLGLELKVYSVIHTHVLISVPKPLIGEVYVRPGNSGIWSVIVSPYYEKNSSQKQIRDDVTSSLPALLHFHTDGISCSLLAALKLDFDPSVQAKFTWSHSGKWISYFDTFHSLNTHKLSVFNILGIHDKVVKHTTCHVSQATRTLDYKADSLESRLAGLTPKSIWGHIDSVEYIVVIPTSTKNTLSIRVSDISNSVKSQMHDADLDSGQIWQVSRLEKAVNYRRVNRLPHIQSFSWSKSMSFGSCHLIAAENCVIIFKSHFNGTLAFEIVATIIVDSHLLDAIELSNECHALIFADHIVLHTPAGMEVIASSHMQYSDVKLIENTDVLKISVIETTSGGLSWKQHDHKLIKGNRMVQKSEFSDVAITEKNNPRDALAKAIKAGGNRVDRIVTSEGRGDPSDSSGLGEEITDTFQAQKRRKR